MEGKDPVILSSDVSVKETFRKMVADTADAIIRSYDDNTAYSGKDVYELRHDLENLGFLPEKGTGFDETLRTVEKEIMPHLLRTWSTMYMPHLHAPALTETIASELIIGTFNDSMDSWDQGPAATEIEENMVHGLVKLFGFGPEADGTFTSGGTQSNMAGIIAARDWYCGTKFGHDVKKKGLPSFYSRMRLYTSEVSHFSMEKTCHVMGLGYDSVRKLPVDSRCKIDIEKFEAMVKEDIAAGLLPFCAVATIGTTDYGSIDDVSEMRRICDKYGMFLHADASYGSGLVMSPRYRDRMGDMSLCDSVTVDFHKMFLLPISCSVILFKKKNLQECFELHADYLNREEDEEEGYINLVDKSLQTTRRFDALKVFMAFRTRGQEGFAKIIDTAVENAGYFYERLLKDPVFIAPVKPEISSVVFAVKDGDEANKNIRKRLMSEGSVIGQTSKDGRVMLKFTLLNPNLTHEHIDRIIARIKEIREELV
ncbi:MAG: diaminobutyrate decarboxylase [Spirochaetales bacterium]|nr:diaminobutyrate decarboxylase [Spirochaetales bacterium]